MAWSKGNVPTWEEAKAAGVTGNWSKREWDKLGWRTKASLMKKTTAATPMKEKPGVILPWHKESPTWAKGLAAGGAALATGGAGMAAIPALLGGGAAAVPTLAPMAGAAISPLAMAAALAKKYPIPAALVGAGGGLAATGLLQGGGEPPAVPTEPTGPTPDVPGEDTDWTAVFDSINDNATWLQTIAYLEQVNPAAAQLATDRYAQWLGGVESLNPEIITLPTGETGYWAPTEYGREFRVISRPEPEPAVQEPTWAERLAEAEYMARPENWLQVAHLRGETPTAPGAVAQFTPGLEAGQAIGQGMQYKSVIPSMQAWHAMTPTEQAQLRGWMATGSGGHTPEEFSWQMQKLAPPGGGRKGLVYGR